MKRLSSIYLLFSSFILMGCSNDKDNELIAWDCSAYMVFIDIQDADRNNIFSDYYHGIVSLDDKTPDITYTYKGETKPIIYVPDDVPDDVTLESRYYYPQFNGVCVTDSYHNYYIYNPYFKHTQICFGEFDATKDLNESVTLNWPDGTHSKIEFTASAVTLNKPYHHMNTRVDDGDWMESTYTDIAILTFVK